MVRALKFTKIDYMRCRKQGRLMILILVIGLFFSKGENNGFLTGLVYTVFVGSIFINAVFADFTMHNVGFLLLLPGNVWHRVSGRFIYGIGCEAALCTVYWLLAAVIRGDLIFMVQSLPISLAVMLTGIAMADLQFMTFYLVGEMKSQYAMALVRVVFPLCFWIMGFGTLNIIGEENEAGMALMSVLNWVSARMALFGILMFGFVAALTFISIWISAKVCGKRDYA